MISRSSALILFFISANCINTSAMEQTTPSSITKTVMVTLDADSPEPRKVPVRIQVVLPETLTTDKEAATYYASQKANIFAKLQQVMLAYEHEKTKNILHNNFVAISPTEFVFNPDQNTLDIRENWQTHQITNTLTAHLETRMFCTYSPKERILKANIPLLHIMMQGSAKEQTVGMHELHAFYPHPTALNLNPVNGHIIAAQMVEMSIEKARGLQQGKKAEELPNPEAYRRSLYMQDLTKMVRYYIEHTTQKTGRAESSAEQTPLKQKQYYCHYTTATLDYDYLKRALPVKILIEVPESSSLSAQAVYNQNAEKFNNEWGKVVKAFIHMMTKGKHPDHMIPLMPTSFYFHPQSNLVIASCEWGTHAITNHVTATLETRYHCIYNSQNDSLNHRMSKLLIKQSNEHKTISVDIDTLNAVYPRPKSLACAKSKMQGLLQQFTYQMAMRSAFLQQGVTENLPDPLKFLYDLYKEDLKKLAANYLHYQVTELIGDID